MSKGNLPAKRDNDKIIRTILYGPIGEWIHEQVTKTDYDRQVEAVLKMKKNGMDHGHVKLTSTREGTIKTGKGDIIYKQAHEGVYTW